MRISIEEARKIHLSQREALQDLTRVVEKVLNIANSDRHYDDTENDVFNELRVIYNSAKNVLR